MTTNPVASFIRKRPILSIVIFLPALLWISTQMPSGQKAESKNSSYKKIFAEGEVDSVLNSGGEIKVTICEDSELDACLGPFLSVSFHK